MLAGKWHNSLVAGHRGCSLAVLTKGMLEKYKQLFVSSISSTASIASCNGVLHVPRVFSTQNQLMLLHMLLSQTPSFMGLSEQCIARLSAKAFHRHVRADQLVYVEGDDADLYALVIHGRVASYSGLMRVTKALLAPHVCGHIPARPFENVAPTAMSETLHRLAVDPAADECWSESAVGHAAVWEQVTVSIDCDGSLSQSNGQTNVTLGNVKTELTDIDAAEALLAQCRLMLQPFSSLHTPHVCKLRDRLPSVDRFVAGVWELDYFTSCLQPLCWWWPLCYPDQMLLHCVRSSSDDMCIRIYI